MIPQLLMTVIAAGLNSSGSGPSGPYVPPTTPNIDLDLTPNTYVILTTPNIDLNL